MNEAIQFSREILGLGNQVHDLTILQVTARAIIVFISTIAMVRLADKRFLAGMTAFDAVLAFLMASMLSRAINGAAPFFPTLAAGFVLVVLHRLVALVARHSHRFGMLVKGTSQPVIVDGSVLPDAMRRNHLSEHDLLEELRLEGKVESPAAVKRATMERNGKISVIPKSG